MLKLDSKWNTVSKDYKILGLIGQGAGGMVVQAMNRETKKMVAVKRIDF